MPQSLRTSGTQTIPGDGLTSSAKTFIGSIKEGMQDNPVDLSGVPIADYRQMCNGYAALSGSKAKSVLQESIDLPISDGVILKATIFDKDGEESLVKPVMIWVPGGGFISYLRGCHDSACSIIAANSGCRVILVYPRLAPEFKAPIPLHDVCAAVKTIADNSEKFHIDPGQIFLGGDSSGANLSLGCAIQLREAKKAGKSTPELQALMLLSGTYDLSLSVRKSGEWTDYEAQDFLGDDSFEYMFKHYLPEGMERSHPMVSPYFCDLKGLPPLHLVVAEYDGVRSQTEALKVRCLNEELSHTYSCLTGQTHSCLLLRGVMPDGVDPAMLVAELLPQPFQPICKL